MDQHTPTDSDALLRLLQQVSENYQEPPPTPLRRGKQRDFSGLSFLLLAVAAVTTRTFRDSELHKLLMRDAPLRGALGFPRVPHRTTIGRRIAGLVPEAEAQVAALGGRIAEEVRPPPGHSQVSAIDGRMYEARGPKWHKADRLKGRVPASLRDVDTESTWSKSGYRGWVQGYRLTLQGLAWPCPVPLWAAWRANRENEAAVATRALEESRLQVTGALLGDTTYGTEPFTAAYAAAGGWVLTPRQLPHWRRSWKRDLYSYRKETIELLFQRVVQACDLKACPSKGRDRNGAFVIASVWLYQVVFLSNYRAGRPAAHVKEQLDLARWRIAA
jgi:hypothetical protein